LHVSLQQAEDFVLPDTMEVLYFPHDQKMWSRAGRVIQVVVPT
jgi:hypothetical protein